VALVVVRLGATVVNAFAGTVVTVAPVDVTLVCLAIFNFPWPHNQGG
jgi:hypothetical protein